MARWPAALAAAGAVGISLAAGALAWVGAVSQGVSLSLPKMLEAGANCLPTAIVFLGIAALAYAALPRAGSFVAYGLLVVAYLWQLFRLAARRAEMARSRHSLRARRGGPAVAFRPGAAALMVAIGLLASLASIALFERRDLTGA